MAAVSSCRKVSCYIFRRKMNWNFLRKLQIVRQRARPVPTIANEQLCDRAHCRDCPGNREEGAGYGRSVCSESPRLHARNNGEDNGMQLRKEKLNL